MNRTMVRVMIAFLLLMIATGAVCGTLGFRAGRASAEPGIAWLWESSGPGLTLEPFTAMASDGDRGYAEPAKTTDSIEATAVSARRWDVRWRDTDEGEGFMLYDGDTLYHRGDPTKVWFRFVEYHPPEVDDGD